MFKKVLVAEDMDSVNYAVAKVLDDLEINKVEHAQYCDKAYVMFKKALQEKDPYDLLICDLSFKPDHREEKIRSGQELIAALRAEDPNLKVLVNSIEDHPQTVKNLWETGNIDGYVCKDRSGMKELRQAMMSIHDGRAYNSPKIEDALKRDNLFILDELDFNLLNCIAKGLTQDEIQEEFKKQNISPNSKSSIEKRLKELRERFNARTTAHLIAIVADMKLI